MKRFAQAYHPVTTAQRLFYVNAVIWSLIGVTSLIRYTDDKGTDNTATMVVIAVLMFGNVAAMLICGWGLGTGQQGYYLLALVILNANILLTVTDEFGILDLITLVIDLVLLAILALNRSRFY